MLGVADSPLSIAQAFGILASEPISQSTHRFVAQLHAPLGHHVLYLVVTQAERNVQLDALADDIHEESMAAIVKGSFIPYRGVVA